MAVNRTVQPTPLLCKANNGLMLLQSLGNNMFGNKILLYKLNLVNIRLIVTLQLQISLYVKWKSDGQPTKGSTHLFKNTDNIQIFH